MSVFGRFEGVDPEQLVDFLVQNRSILPKTVRERLASEFSPQNIEKVGGQEDIDLHAEVVAQLKAVKALRESVITSSGTLQVGARDAKDSLAAATSLLSLLVKIQEDVYNQNRVRTLQKTLIEALKDADIALQVKFMTLLEERLRTA